MTKWVVWGVLSAALFISFFHRVAPAVVADQLMVEFATTATGVGALASIYFYAYMAMQIPTGALADTLGPRLTVFWGSVIAAVGALLFGLAPSLPLAYVGRLLVGMGVAVAFICVLKAQSIWFKPNQFALLSGLLSIVSTGGAIVAAAPLAAAADAFGWRPAFVVSAGLSLFVAALTWWLVRDHPVQPIARGSAASTVGLGTRAAARIVWRNRQTWLCFGAHFGWFGTYLTFTGLWGVPYLIHVYELERVTAAALISAASVGYSIGAVLLGTASDRWLGQRKPPMLAAGVVFLGCWLLLVAWPGGRPPLALTVIAFVVACAAAAANLLCFALAKESNPPEAAGLAMASANGGILCAAFLQPLLGYVLDLGWQGQIVAGARVYPVAAYQVAFSAFLLAGGLAITAALLTRESYCRNLTLADRRRTTKGGR
ncbi:MAG: MFS transporter [Chloroflexi bacterium]|nr:MFS transporter [Chloroflexota bacterium]